MTNTTTRELIGTGTASRLAGVTATRLRQLDAVLSPVMIDGRRFYDRAAIERFAATRDARRSP